MSLTDLPVWLYGQTLKILTDMGEKIVRLTIDLRKAWFEMKEASHRERKAKIEADVTEAAKDGTLFEIEVSEMLRKFRKLYSETRAKNSDKTIVPIIKREPGDKAEVFDEAMRRLKQDSEPRSTPRLRG